MQILAAILLSVIASSPVEYRDSIRDVYIDGRLDRSAQTLAASTPRMFAVMCGEEVLLVDRDAASVSRGSRADFAFNADRTVATTTAALPAASAGAVVRTGSTYLATVGGRTILIAPHQSKAGPMTAEELWETAPVWRSIADVYQPDGSIVERLRAIDRPIRLEIVLATWCGDSRQHVPRLLKSIAMAANPNITVELIGIDSEFTAPMDVIASRNITNVPTVIVSAGGKELGRMVETPSGATVEDDVCDVAGGTVKPHRGRYERGALVASGTYELRDAHRKREGTETFELYERPAGGVIAHSLIARRDGTSVETWAWPEFVEVTHRASLGVTRTRFRREKDHWTANSRGTDGIVEQTVAAPAALVTPATITWAWARGAAAVYVAPEQGVGQVGKLDARVGPGVVPRYVRFGDGSERWLMR